MSTADVIRIHKHGGPEEMRFEQMDLPPPGPGQVRLKQTAIGLNFIDVYTRTGLYPGPTPAVLGVEAAGVVEALGEGVTSLKAGDRVVYNGLGGAYASHRNAPADRMVKIPDWVSDEDAAAVFLKGLTVWMLTFEIRRLQPGETILVWAAAGGVGSILVPWANAQGARVIGVVSTPAKAELAKAYGCDATILARMVASHPYAFASSAFAGVDTTPITRAPCAFAHGTRIEPTPPAAAHTRIVSPGCNRRISKVSIQTVSPLRNTAAASSSLTQSGIFTIRSAGAFRCDA